VLIKDGEKQISNLKRTHVTDEDIQEALHLVLQSKDMDRVKDVYFERSGEISFVRDEKKGPGSKYSNE
jgi:uncharacterized membrane protein YcaP (DUF421 family)